MVEKGWIYADMMEMDNSDLYFWINETVKKHNRDNKQSGG